MLTRAYARGKRHHAELRMQAPIRASLPSLAICLLLTFAAGGIGAIASVNAAAFYQGLARPPWAPPAWLFGPVWTVLYVLIGVSAWLVWRKARLTRGVTPYILFGAQLAANALWTWLFFAWMQGALAFFDVILLLVLIAANMAAFVKIKPIAGWLLAPYLAWVAFATALTWSVWHLNPGTL